MVTTWWQRVYDSPTAGVFKIVITEVRNFPEIADYYRQEVAEPGNQLIGSILERGVARGEFRAVDVRSTVMSLILPMVMLCLHKHSLGACTPADTLGDPKQFIRQHIELVLRGLLPRPPEVTTP